MKCWLVTVGETMPAIHAGDRKMRTSLLGEELVRRGHSVIWWNSTVNHRHKTKYFEEDTDIDWQPNFRIRLLNGPIYHRNISLRRYVNHLVVAYKFLKRAKSEARPDFIYCSLPTPELAAAAVRYGRRAGVPVVVDVRDLWPDELHARLSSKYLRLMGRILTGPMSLATSYALKNSKGITAISPSYLAWAIRRSGGGHGDRDRIFYLGYPRLRAPTAESDAVKARFQELGLNPSSKIFLFVGTFTQGIDVEALVDAARELLRRGRGDIQIAIAGEGERKDWLVENSRQLSNIVFVGWQPRAGIEELLRMSWVGLGAYRRHSNVSLGNKIFEYASGRLPVLISLDGDARQLVEDNDFGAYVSPENGVEWATQIERYADDLNLRARQSANAAKFFASDCEAEAIYPRLAAFLEDTSAGTGD